MTAKTYEEQSVAIRPAIQETFHSVREEDILAVIHLHYFHVRASACFKMFAHRQQNFVRCTLTE